MGALRLDGNKIVLGQRLFLSFFSEKLSSVRAEQCVGMARWRGPCARFRVGEGDIWGGNARRDICAIVCAKCLRKHHLKVVCFYNKGWWEIGRSNKSLRSPAINQVFYPNISVAMWKPMPELGGDRPIHKGFTRVETGTYKRWLLTMECPIIGINPCGTTPYRSRLHLTSSTSQTSQQNILGLLTVLVGINVSSRWQKQCITGTRHFLYSNLMQITTIIFNNLHPQFITFTFAQNLQFLY